MPHCLIASALLILCATTAQAQPPYDRASDRQSASDRWVATDALGRTLPGFAQVGPPRANRFVGMFYFLWLGEHGSAGPFDITEILKRDPDAMQHPESPLWGPISAPHQWGKSVFGYYRSDDAYVLRKHAQLLSDAGVDTVIFDVTNNLTYPRSYHALCRVWSQIRKEGGRTPQIAFLCPFGDAAPVVEALYDDLYQPGRYSNLWFRWQGKPLIMADLATIRSQTLRGSQRTPGLLARGATFGQSFIAARPFTGIGGSLPTYGATTSGVTVSLYDGSKPGGKLRARKTFPNLSDNAVALLESDAPWLPGAYYLEISAPTGQVGWWSESGDRYAGGQAFADGVPVSGDRSLFLRDVGTADALPLLRAESALTPADAQKRANAIRQFFTFRKPQPDYFAGQTAPNQWGWLEVSPQHGFGKTPDGRPEQMTVGVAQNAVDGKLGVLSNPKAYGRSFHDGTQPPPDQQNFLGRNFTEQWENALRLDPAFIFVTGWNEWIAGRFNQTAPFYGAGPVNFVDQFNHEYSRDIEPVVGGHTDSYYYQFVAQVRRYKGVRPPLPPTAPLARPVTIDGRFADWRNVGTVYTDDAHDDSPRDHPAWNPATRYTNRTGRNDFVTLKVAHDARNVYFYARTRRPIQSAHAPGAMQLSVRADRKTFTVTGVPRKVRGSEIEIAIPRARLGLRPGEAVRLTFKWRDNVGDTFDALNLYRNGDTAPNARFEYVYNGAATGR